MRSYDPENEDDIAALAEINPETWQTELLMLNPAYTHWGPHEDCMWNKDEGYTSPMSFNSWKDFDLVLDDWNEVVHFYFNIQRPSQKCSHCINGYHRDTVQLRDTFKTWIDQLQQDEVNTLVHDGMLKELVQTEYNRETERYELKAGENYPEADTVNAYHKNQSTHNIFYSSDMYYFLKAHSAYKGLHFICENCQGKTYEYTDTKCTVNLVLWILHPRKGASRGCEIKNITQPELPEVFHYLNVAAQRCAERVAKITKKIDL